ncbi:FtsX-like permease family protein [Nocardioides dubius]|uniref:ABC3 transporter permease C-terminal domain-containing protein n=1 Tax=Nocardioides dubius TaxID=317019 RepID=A0ABN1TRT3_9ACTN
MIRLAVQSARHDRSRHLGSVAAVGLGVWLIGLVALLMASVERYLSRLSPGQEEVRVALQDTTSLLGVMAGFAGFMAIFVVASTSSFVVAARARELGLLRLVGATPRQVRRMIRIETLVVAIVASALGCALAVLTFPAATWLLEHKGLAPGGLPGPALVLPLSVAAGIGVLVALLGARSAARRASRTVPAAALREADELGRPVGVVRVLCGVFFLAAGVAMLLLIRAGDPLLALVLAIFVPEVWVIALVCLGPVLLPLLARALTRPWRADPLVAVARENVAVRARRTTSLAAPVLALSAIAGSVVLTLSFAADWEEGITRQRLAAPLVVTTDSPREEARLREVDGLTLDPRVLLTAEVGGADDAYDTEIDVIDPEVSSRLRGIGVREGTLAELGSGEIAVSRSAAWDNGIGVGERVPVRVAGGEVERLEVVAIYEDAANLIGEFALSGEADAARGATVTGTWFVDSATPAAAVREGWPDGAGAVQGRDAWIEEQDQALRSQNTIGLWAVLGPTGVYSALAIANTLLLGSVQRRREFATFRLVGASAQQVRRLVVLEALIVAGAALLLGALITAVTGVLLRAPMTAGLDDVALTMPWTAFGAIAATCAGVAVVAALAGSGRLKDGNLRQSKL